MMGRTSTIPYRGRTWFGIAYRTYLGRLCIAVAVAAGVITRAERRLRRGTGGSVASLRRKLQALAVVPDEVIRSTTQCEDGDRTSGYAQDISIRMIGLWQRRKSLPVQRNDLLLYTVLCFPKCHGPDVQSVQHTGIVLHINNSVAVRVGASMLDSRHDTTLLYRRTRRQTTLPRQQSVQHQKTCMSCHVMACHIMRTTKRSRAKKKKTTSHHLTSPHLAY